MHVAGRVSRAGLRPVVVAAMVALVVLAIGVPGGRADMAPEVSTVICVFGDQGCRINNEGVGGICPYESAIQPVTCSFPAIPSFATGKTRVSTGVRCTFAFPLITPFPPPGGVTIWSTAHGTAIIRPDGSIVIHCPPK